jgi:hypothetical protein
MNNIWVIYRVLHRVVYMAMYGAIIKATYQYYTNNICQYASDI